MKKIMALGLALLTMLTMFTGCGGKDTMYSLGLEVLKITDSFLDGNTTSSEALEKIDDIWERSKMIGMPEEGSPEGDIWDELIAVAYPLTFGETISEPVLSCRNRLAEALGKPLRDK